MRTYQPRATTVDALVELRCDRCGRVCVRADEGIDATLADHALGFGSVATFNASWGCQSGRDGERWAAEVCEDCATTIKRLIDDGAGVGVQAQAPGCP